MLKRRKVEGLYHYNQQGKKTEGKNPKMSGNCENLKGDCTHIYGGEGYW